MRKHSFGLRAVGNRVGDAVMRIGNAAMGSSLVNAALSQYLVFYSLRLVIDVFASAFVPIKSMPYSNLMLLGLLAIAVVMDFQEAFLLLLLYMGVTYLAFNFTEQKKRAASRILMFLFYREDETDLIRFVGFGFIFLLYLVWYLQ